MRGALGFGLIGLEIQSTQMKEAVECREDGQALALRQHPAQLSALSAELVAQLVELVVLHSPQALSFVTKQ